MFIDAPLQPRSRSFKTKFCHRFWRNRQIAETSNLQNLAFATCLPEAAKKGNSTTIISFMDLANPPRKIEDRNP